MRSKRASIDQVHVEPAGMSATTPSNRSAIGVPAPARGLVDRLWRIGLWVAYRLLLCFWFVARPRQSGVYIAVWHGSRILIIRNSYRAWINLPCGGIGRGESPIESAMRELKEEVGITATVEMLREVGTFYSRREFYPDTSTVFELLLDEEPVPRIDNREVVWAGFVDVETALATNLADVPTQYLAQRSAQTRSS